MDYLKSVCLIFIKLSLLAVFAINASAETTFFDNPDDMFVMSSSSTMPTEDRGTIGGGGCAYKWNCTDWGECLQSGKQIRDCTNIGTCSDTYKSPKIEQNCTYTAPEAEKESITEEEAKIISEKEITDKNNIFIYIIIIFIAGFVIFYLKRFYKNSFRNISKSINKKYGGEGINGLLNYISSLVSRKVYTEDGIYVGDVAEVILGTNRIDSIKIDIKSKNYKFDKMKGCIINIKNIQSFGEIIIADKEVINKLIGANEK